MTNKQITVEELCKKTFLFEGTEVKLTGRIAKKNKRSGDNMLFEIRPREMGNVSWKKWVHLSDMYEIFDTTASRNVSLAPDLIEAIKRAVDRNK